MAIKTSGPLSLTNDIAGEFGGTAPHAMSEYYGAASGIPGVGNALNMSTFYGKSGVTTYIFEYIVRGYWNTSGKFGASFVIDSYTTNGVTYSILVNTEMDAWQDVLEAAVLSVYQPVTLSPNAVNVGRLSYPSPLTENYYSNSTIYGINLQLGSPQPTPLYTAFRGYLNGVLISTGSTKAFTRCGDLACTFENSNNIAYHVYTDHPDPYNTNGLEAPDWFAYWGVLIDGTTRDYTIRYEWDIPQ
jgi:hypothetical protein